MDRKLTDLGLELMKKDKEIVELIEFYQNNTQYFKVKLLEDKQKEIRRQIELEI